MTIAEQFFLEMSHRGRCLMAVPRGPVNGVPHWSWGRSGGVDCPECTGHIWWQRDRHGRLIACHCTTVGCFETHFVKDRTYDRGQPASEPAG